MIPDQVTFSAPTENPQQSYLPPMIRRLVAVMLGGALSLAPVVACAIDGATVSPRQEAGAVSLPAIPDGAARPWLKPQPAPAAMKVDTLMLPGPAPAGIRPDLIPPHSPQLPAAS